MFQSRAAQKQDESPGACADLGDDECGTTQEFKRVTKPETAASAKLASADFRAGLCQVLAEWMKCYDDGEVIATFALVTRHGAKIWGQKKTV